MIMCTFKLVGVSNYELYRKFHGTKSLEEYAEYLASFAAPGNRTATGVRVERNGCSGPDVWIIREKHLDEDTYVRFFTGLWKKFGDNQDRAVLIPHTYPAAARKTGCSRIHLPLPLLRKYYGTENLAEIREIGVSVHSAEEAREAENLGAVYLTLGHVFATDCKAGLLPRGISFLNQVCDSVRIPVYAIGGIHMENLHQIRESQGAGACMMSEYMRARGQGSA